MIEKWKVPLILYGYLTKFVMFGAIEGTCKSNEYLLHENAAMELHTVWIVSLPQQISSMNMTIQSYWFWPFSLDNQAYILYLW